MYKTLGSIPSTPKNNIHHIRKQQDTVWLCVTSLLCYMVGAMLRIKLRALMCSTQRLLTQRLGTGEMALWLRALVALKENPGSLPSTHIHGGSIF